MSWHKRLLSAGEGFREWYWTDADGNVALETEWLVDPIVDIAKARFNQFDERSNWKGDVHHVGFVPNYVIDYEWRVNRRRMLSDREYVRHWLNDPRNSGFRTRPGRL